MRLPASATRSLVASFNHPNDDSNATNGRLTRLVIRSRCGHLDINLILRLAKQARPTREDYDSCWPSASLICGRLWGFEATHTRNDQTASRQSPVCPTIYLSISVCLCVCLSQSESSRVELWVSLHFRLTRVRASRAKKSFTRPSGTKLTRHEHSSSNAISVSTCVCVCPILLAVKTLSLSTETRDTFYRAYQRALSSTHTHTSSKRIKMHKELLISYMRTWNSWQPKPQNAWEFPPKSSNWIWLPSFKSNIHSTWLELTRLELSWLELAWV